MKTQRQAKILEIVSTRDVETQEQLLQELHDAGFYSTQATISRDIKELRIVKELTGFGTYRYTTSSKEVTGTFSARLNTIFRECVTGFDYAQNLVVIHTLPGLANAAASCQLLVQNVLKKRVPTRFVIRMTIRPLINQLRTCPVPRVF